MDMTEDRGVGALVDDGSRRRPSRRPHHVAVLDEHVGIQPVSVRGVADLILYSQLS